MAGKTIGKCIDDSDLEWQRLFFNWYEIYFNTYLFKLCKDKREIKLIETFFRIIPICKFSLASIFMIILSILFDNKYLEVNIVEK